MRSGAWAMWRQRCWPDRKTRAGRTRSEFFTEISERDGDITMPALSVDARRVLAHPSREGGISSCEWRIPRSLTWRCGNEGIAARISVPHRKLGLRLKIGRPQLAEIRSEAPAYAAAIRANRARHLDLNRVNGIGVVSAAIRVSPFFAH